MKKLNLLIIFSILFLSAPVHAEPTRALKLIATDAATQQTGEVQLYRKAVAVIIGIDQYPNLPADRQLSYAVHDAQGVADVLKRQYRFEQIITLYNKEATRKAITKLLEVDLPKQLGEQDAVFIFWAGHGNQESSREGDIGYLIPYDGDPNDLTTNLTMTEIRDTVSKRIPAKHIFYVMDACYAGVITETRSVEKTPRRDLAYLRDITNERVRQVLTAGGKNQEVLDGGANGHSVFTGRLIELLERAGDFITANEIQAILREKVNGDARARNHPQTPAFGTLYGSGDFVFIPRLEQIDTQAEIARLEAEAAVAALAAKRAQTAKQQREADIAQRAREGKLKALQLKQAQLAAEEKRRTEQAAEQQRLLAAKTADEQRLAQLKAQADARRQTQSTQAAGDFPTIESAVAEIKRLNERINQIEASYAKELEETRKKVNARYAAQLNALDAEQRDEFDSAAEFNARQAKKRAELKTQREAELAQLNVNLAAGETAPLRASIKTLAEREYTLGLESIAMELGSYNTETQQFPINMRSKTPNLQLAFNGTIALPPAEARIFKQQFLAGLIRPEARVKTASAEPQLALLNDENNLRLILFGAAFMTQQKQQENQDQAYRIEMIRIPSRNYELGKFEVTQAQWLAVMGNNPSDFTACGNNCPVEQVSWNDIQEFLQKLNAKTGKNYRLPTEAEWEYACYGGTKTEYCGSNDINAVAWYDTGVHPPRR
jgi:formylglycine-generating enzyme required for sulfatase activity